jgi:ferredoxin
MGGLKTLRTSQNVNQEENEMRDIIVRLKDLAEDRASFFREDGDDEIFREDYDALLKAVKALEELEKDRNCDHAGRCSNCRVRQTECLSYHVYLARKYERLALENAVACDEAKYPQESEEKDGKV